MAGPVPARVDADVKAGLLDLVDEARGQGWSQKAACRILEVNPDRVTRWRRRQQRAEGLLTLALVDRGAASDSVLGAPGDSGPPSQGVATTS